MNEVRAPIAGVGDARPIPGFEGYFATADGKIWTSKRKGGNARAAGLRGELRPLKANPNKRGYLLVGLDVDGRNVSRFVHRLILETFVGPRPEGKEACHFPDHEKSNNALSNLRWDTHDENIEDNYRNVTPSETKVCRGLCGLEKPRGDFYGDKRARDGLKTECKSCHLARSKQ